MGTENDEILQAYVEESQEHLADIENDLLIIEKAGADIDDALVNKVFRAAHSIKGGAGFLGQNKIKDLSHNIENVLGLIRNGEIVPESDVVNILLLAFDKLREMINNIDQSDEIDISEPLVSLAGLTAASLPADEKKSVTEMVNVSHPDGKVVFTVVEFDIVQSKQNGKTLYLIEYDLIHDVHKKGKTPMEILDVLKQSGIILESKIDFAAVGTLEDETPSNRIPFFVLFSTVVEPDHMGILCEVDDNYIHQINDEMIFQTSSTDESEEERVAEESATQPESPELTFQLEVDPPSEEDIPVEKEKALSSTKIETTLRVNVSLLDSLMTLAGELVLSRNQLLQAISSHEQRSLEIAGQRTDLITSELQEAIMLTRMQPIGNLFNKFSRMVRDLARNLGKEIELILEGKDVELDKTINEGLSDPLTHLVRNSVDHGIETPDIRRKAGKNPTGKIVLKAYHEAGQVNIEITDDGKGIDSSQVASAAISKGLITEEQARTMSEREKVNLIFLPGFSTAEEVTDVSGRGVGMDVVKNNLDKLGGLIDIDSSPGKGSTIRIKLPLTLAIIPSLLVSTCGERYAIPQVNVEELLRIPASQVKDRIETVGNAEVVRLRGQLLPLLSLADVLEVKRTYIDPSDGVEKQDRRKKIADRRSMKSPAFKSELDKVRPSLPDDQKGETISWEDRRKNPDRRQGAYSAVNIVVVSAGVFKYGLVVDELHDSEEIVVKPLGRHLKQCRGYAGATILGDGRVAIILDVASLARIAELTSMAGTDRASEVAQEAGEGKKDKQSLLVFRVAEDEQFAVSLGMVERIEKIKRAEIESVGGRKVIQYRGGTLPLYGIEEVAQVKPLAETEELLVIVFLISGREIGFLATGPLDAIDTEIVVDETVLKQTGIMGSAIIGGHTTLMVDIFGLIEALNPEWFTRQERMAASNENKATILFAEDSEFFRKQLRNFIEEEGYGVIEAEDGMMAWELLQKHANEIALVVTDIEMPNMDGYSFTEKIKADERFSHLPVIAVTSLAGDEDIARGKEAGIDDYQVKLDREKLMESIYNYTKT
jgi:two-component system chemotaxis sensor kinase CheA